jgi:hypothetical protein
MVCGNCPHTGAQLAPGGRRSCVGLPRSGPSAGRVAARVPPQLLSGRTRVLRPVDAVRVYAHPRPECARLERSGALRRVAPGYYAVVPDDRVGLAWLPELEAVALGVGVAAAGVDGAALMGLSAVRVHGGIPRAVGVAVVAMARHRPVLQLTDRDAVVLFVRRNLDGLDLQRHQTELGEGWVASIEQTVVDLAARPDLGAMPQAVIAAVGGACASGRSAAAGGASGRTSSRAERAAVAGSGALRCWIRSRERRSPSSSASMLPRSVGTI